MKVATNSPSKIVFRTKTPDARPFRRLLLRKSGIVSRSFAAIFLLFLAVAFAPTTHAVAYGSLNNFDCVNDTGVEAHGFDIELVDLHSTDITYTYDYNHYGVPKITENNADPAHPKVLVRYASAKNPDGTWAAYTAIPSAPILPTDGHQFTNPSINFGGEHFGVGYYNTPSAVLYNWLIDDGSGNLVHGPSVNVSTPTFTYVAPPAPNIPAQVIPVVVPPPPPVLPPKQFGDASWVKDIKTTSHNANKVHLEDLVGDDPGLPQPWANGEPDEVETEWRILQTDFNAAGGGINGELQGAPEDLPGGDEVITRRYEFYRYIGPFDAESGEAMADTVGQPDPDGIHYFGTGTVTYNDHIDPISGEWITVTVDLSTIWVVGEFFGAQMSGFDVAPALGLLDHLQDGELNLAYPNRTVVIPGGAPFLATLKDGALPDGLTFDEVSGVLSGTPTTPGAFTFTIDASDTTGALLSKSYTITIPGDAVVTSTINTSVLPAGSGTTTGHGTYNDGTPITVIASHNPGYAFVNWTENGVQVSDKASYPFTVNGNRTLVANFVPTFTIATGASPASSGTTTGDGVYNSGADVTVAANPNPGYEFVNWTDNGVEMSTSLAYSFSASADRILVANFLIAVATSASPPAGGTVVGGGAYSFGSPVSLSATPNPGYAFINWTENGAVVSASANYTFNASDPRALVANFSLTAPALSITSVSAVRTGSKVDVTVVVGNSGGLPAQSVTIASKKDATIDGKITHERAPLVLGDIAPVGGTGTAVLTFNGVKAGDRTLRIVLVYSGGTATLSMAVPVQ